MKIARVAFGANLARDHILAYHSTSIHAASSVFLLRCACSGTDKTPRNECVALVWIGLFHGYVSDTHRLMRKGAMSKQR